MSKIWLRLLVLAVLTVFMACPALAANKKSAKIVPDAEKTATAQQADKAAPENQKATAVKSDQQDAKPATAPAAATKPDKATKEQGDAQAPAKTAVKPAAKPKAPTKAKPVKAARKKSSSNPLGLSGSSQEPIKIISNRLEADDKSGTVIFTGKVKAVQGDTTLYCDKLTVFFSKVPIPGKPEEDAQRELTRIVTEGHVKVVLPGQVAYGQKGVYQIAEGLIILKGKPKIVRGGNTLTGAKIMVYLNENRAIVEGGEQMVEAVIIPQSMEQNNQSGTDGGDAGPGSGIGTVSAGTN